MSEILAYSKGAIINPDIWNAKHTLPTGVIMSYIETALNTAEVEGFINPVAFGTVIWLYLTVGLRPELTEELDKIIETDSVFAAMDKLQNDGVINDLIKDHSDDVIYTFSLAEMWYRQYAKFTPTFAGQVGKLSFLTEDFVKDAIQGVQKVLSEGNAEKVMQIAEAWGMDNELTKEVGQA